MIRFLSSRFCLIVEPIYLKLIVFFFNDTATTEIYTLSLHDALPISLTASVRRVSRALLSRRRLRALRRGLRGPRVEGDRKSTRLNSSHANISYAVFCLKNKNKNTNSKILTHPFHISSMHTTELQKLK